MKKPLTDLCTEPFTARREWTVEGVPVLEASVSLPMPVSTREAVTRRIRRYYQLQCRSYLRYCETILLPLAAAEYHTALENSAPLPLFRAELTYCVTYNEGGLWSLYTQSRESTLPGRTLLTRRGDTWDLAAGYPTPLSAFFQSRSGWKKRLLQLAAEDICRQEASGMARYREDWRRRLRRSFNSRNYYLTSSGLSFFFPMYALAPVVEGIPTFTVPYRETAEKERPSC